MTVHNSLNLRPGLLATSNNKIWMVVENNARHVIDGQYNFIKCDDEWMQKIKLKQKKAHT